MKKAIFTATFAEWVGKVIIWSLVTIFTFGIGIIWVYFDFIKWTISKIEVNTK